MTTLYLITHAHTAADPAVDARKWHLSPTGVRQAARLAEQPWWSEVSCVVVSSETKTRLTVAPLLARRTLPVMVDPRVDELKRSGWTTDYSEHVQRTFADPDRAHGGWEPASAALARIRAAVHDLAKTHPYAVLALVSHGLILSLLRADLLHLPRVRFDDWRHLSFAAVARMEISAACDATLITDFEPVAAQQSRA